MIVVDNDEMLISFCRFVFIPELTSTAHQ